jgi:ribosomal protein S18 acetylase RimI-like enzyme
LSVLAHDRFGAPVYIDEATADEWQRVRAIRLDTLNEAPYAFGSTFENESQQPEEWWRQRLIDGRWFIARDGEADVALTMLMEAPIPDSFESNGSVAVAIGEQWPWIRSVWTRPAARGRMIVDALMLHVCDTVAEAGIDFTVLGVRAGNDRAHAAYVRMGFIDIGTFIPGSASVEQPNWLMARASSLSR